VDVDVRQATLRFVSPVATAFGALHERSLFVVTVRGADGVIGLGEAAPLEAYDGVPDAAVAAALGGYREALRDAGDASGGEILDACRAVADLPQAIAAIDLALWDRAGRREGVSVASLIADTWSDTVAVNATIGATDRASAAEAALRARLSGFGCVKVKVGVGDDAGRVAAVRAAAGPRMQLRLDANGAWTVDEAVRTIEALSPAGLEFVEEPVHGVAAMRAVRERVAVRVSMDETAAEAGALTASVADAVCLKISRCGGIAGLLAQAALVRASGAEVYVASSFDGPLGIAAGLHCAAALRCQAACGLATLELFEGMADVLPVRRGAMTVPTGPGLGVEFPA
jgi:L-alanine-DL-glutamate epimerase-like enolase superfamily enzyme